MRAGDRFQDFKKFLRQRRKKDHMDIDIWKRPHGKTAAARTQKNYDSSASGCGHFVFSVPACFFFFAYQGIIEYRDDRILSSLFFVHDYFRFSTFTHDIPFIFRLILQLLQYLPFFSNFFESSLNVISIIFWKSSLV